MKKIKYLLLITVLLAMNFSCDNYEDETTPLPREIIIRLTDKNLSERSVSLIASQTIGNQFGKWSVISENETQGEFSAPSNSLTRFKGSILETYIIRWTISNGKEEIYKDFKISMYEEESLDEIIKIERNITKLFKLARAGVFKIFSVAIHFSIEELKDYLTIKEMINHGLSPLYLYDSGITITQMLNSGFTFEKIWRDFTSAYNESNESPTRNLTEYFYKENFTPVDFFNEGISVKTLLDYGTTLRQILETNFYTLSELITSDYSQIPLTSILELNFTKQTLIEENILIKTPIDGFYIMNYVFIGYWSNTYFIKNDLDEINRLNPIKNSLWRLPTENELLYIFKNNSKDFNLFLLEYGLYQYSAPVTECNYRNAVGKIIERGIHNTTFEYTSCCDLFISNCELFLPIYVLQL